MNPLADRKRIILYLCMGLLYMMIWTFANDHRYPGNFGALTLNNAWRVPYVMVLNFIFFEYSLPFIFKKRKYLYHNILLGLVIFLVHCMFWSYGMYAWRELGIQLNIYIGFTSFKDMNEAIGTQMAFSVGSLVLFGIIRHIYNYILLKNAAQKLRIEKQAAELNYLKSQTNPHFLFNTLNNIYSLARDKSDLAPESILRLSKILRFMLYETAGAYIAIENELRVLGDYIELEKLRYDSSLQVNFSYNVEDMKQAIPPLLLMPLVENAFKHGVSETRSRPFVDIHLSIEKRILKFIVENSTGTADAGEAIKENIGLSNLRRQLELLYTDYTLKVEQRVDSFFASLTINLASHV